jgi:hypothetical protein
VHGLTRYGHNKGNRGPPFAITEAFPVSLADDEGADEPGLIGPAFEPPASCR